MPEEKKVTILGELKEALQDLPEQYRAAVAKSLIHDIGIIARTIDMVTGQRISA